MSQGSFNEHLDERALRVLGNVQRWRLTEAVRCHMGDTNREREWSRFTDVDSFPCCGRKVSSSFSNSVDEISHAFTATH